MDLSILSYKPEHDGCLAWIKKGQLMFSVEGEKDSKPRYAGINSFPRGLRLIENLEHFPEVLALGGYPISDSTFEYKGKYMGTASSLVSVEKIKLFNKELLCFQSSHERAHLFCSYGLSPFPQGQPVYALCWEGIIGKFYEIDEKMNIVEMGTVMDNPGMRYYLPYAVADYKNRASDPWWYFSLSDAGKMMALTAFGEILGNRRRKNWDKEVNRILNIKLWNFHYGNEQERIECANQLKNSPLLNIGVESEDFKDFSRAMSEGIFNVFYKFAKERLGKKYPLLITGGCGLNCDWNTQWKNSGIFDGVFVPPVTNDSGIAIGMAVDAQQYLGGGGKVDWSVYSGEEFFHDDASLGGFENFDLNFEDVAHHLADGKVLAWIEGKYEIGPRALCHRSLIASPLKREMHNRLNKIKKREDFRPIAPVCLEEEVSNYFEWKGTSPYMLYFQKVKSEMLKAVTHVDNSARVQTVNDASNPGMVRLLKAFKKRTGFPILCNTSLNFKGKGFINRMTDLVKYVNETEVDGFVVAEKLYLKKNYDYRKLESAENHSVPATRIFLNFEEKLKMITWGDQVQNGRMDASFSKNAVVLKYESGTGWGCGVSLISNVRPFEAGGVLDLRGYNFFQFTATVPEGLKFIINMNESSIGDPSLFVKGQMENNGESYSSKVFIGTGMREIYRDHFSNMKLRTSWGNQHGNNILDLQTLESVDFLIPSNQGNGEVSIYSYEFSEK